MSNLLSFKNVSLAYGLDALLDDVELYIAAGERVCLIGRNGAGKSSLLKIIEGSLAPDSGTVWRKPNLRIACLAQQLPLHMPGTVFEFVAEGLAETGALLAAYYALTHRLAISCTAEDLVKLEQLQHQIEIKNGWQYEQEIKVVLSRLTLDPDLKMAELSGGWQRRAALARALVTLPDLLLLDEPTNHLDIETIQWLETQLLNSSIGLIFITHDRSFLQRLANRIVELDRGNLTSWPGDYEQFLKRKEEMLHAEEKHYADFDKKLAQEEKWIRQGVKARRTRNEGRVRALETMRATRSQRREQMGKVNFNIHEGEKSGQLVIEAQHLTHALNHRLLIKDFSVRIMRGDRIGLIGANGIGKSTLLNILLGKIAPQHGTVVQGTKLEVAYVDQFRGALDMEKTVAENVVEGSDTIEINGSKRHIISYLGDFLFTPLRAMTPVKALSGGECNRLLLARLFSRKTNLLIMDEPTNDLDIETLELLEELLSQYQGTLLLVSHDRKFLDNVVTSTLVFEGEGIIQEYVGGYQDWLRQRQPSLALPAKENKAIAKKILEQKSTPPKKLSYKEQKELQKLPARIEQLEQQQHALEQVTISATFYQQAPEKIAATLATLTQVGSDLELAYQRWQYLEKLTNDSVQK